MNKKQVLEIVRTGKLIPHPYNEKIFGTGMNEFIPTKGNSNVLFPTTAYDLKESILKNGIMEPLHVTSDYRILSGHRRFSIANILGIEEVRVLRYAEKLSKEEEELYILVYNIHRKDSAIDFGVLRSERIRLYQNIFGEEFSDFVLKKKIDVEKTAKKLNIPKHVFAKDLTEIRKQETRKENNSKAIENNINLPLVNSTKKHLGLVMSNLECSNIRTAKEIEKAVRKFYTTFIKRMK